MITYSDDIAHSKKEKKRHNFIIIQKTFNNNIQISELVTIKHIITNHIKKNESITVE